MSEGAWVLTQWIEPGGNGCIASMHYLSGGGHDCDRHDHSGVRPSFGQATAPSSVRGAIRLGREGRAMGNSVTLCS